MSPIHICIGHGAPVFKPGEGGPPPPFTAGSLSATAGFSRITVESDDPPAGGFGPLTLKLYRSTTNGVKGSQVAASLPFVDEDVTTGPTYYYTLEVTDGFEVVSTEQASVSLIEALWAPNLPSGLIEEVDLHFEAPFPNGTWGDSSQRWLSGGSGGYALASPEYDTPYGPGVCRTEYPGNHAGNGGGGYKIEGRTIQSKRLYYCIDQILLGSGGTPYVMHTNGEKLIYPMINNGNGGAPQIAMGIAPGHDAYGMASFEMLPQTPGEDPPWIYQPANGIYIPKGERHMIECLCIMNTGSNSNGTWRMWLNGVMCVNFTNIKYTNSGDSSYFYPWRVDGTRGGGASTVLTPPGGQTREWARLSVYHSTTRS